MSSRSRKYATAKLMRDIAIGSIVLMLSFPTYAAPFDISDSSKIGDIISKFHDALSALIKQAGGEMRTTLMIGFQRADAAIQSLEVAYKNSLQSTFDNLDKQERIVFEDTSKLLANLETSTNRPVDEVIGTANDFNTVVGQITINKPTITRYEPSNIPPRDAVAEVKISIGGFKLCQDYKDHVPKIKIGNGEFLTQGKVECINNRLGFVVPRELFGGNDEKVVFSNAVLEVYYDAASWWSLRSDIQPIQYKLMFNVLPPNLGNVKYSATISVDKAMQPILFKSPPLNAFSKNGHNGDEHRCYPLDPKGKFKYDFENAKRVKDSFVGNENLGDITYWDDVQSAYNICIRVTAAITDEHNWANSTGHLEVYLVRVTPEVEDKQIIEQRKLGWGDEVFNLNEKSKKQMLEITLFGGKPHYVSATDPKILPYLQIIPDTRNGVLFLQPQRPWE